MSTVIKLADYKQTITSDDGETLKITKKASESIDSERLERIKSSLARITELMAEIKERSNAED